MYCYLLSLRADQVMISNCPNAGIVFTHGIQLCRQVDGWVGRGKYLVWPVSQNPLDVGCLYWVGILVRSYTVTLYCDLSVTFDLDSVKMFSIVIFKTYFPYDNDIWIAATDYYLRQGSIIFMTVCLSLCLFCVLAAFCKYYWLDLPEKKSEDVSKLNPLKFLE